MITLLVRAELRISCAQVHFGLLLLSPLLSMATPESSHFLTWSRLMLSRWCYVSTVHFGYVAHCRNLSTLHSPHELLLSSSFFFLSLCAACHCHWWSVPIPAVVQVQLKWCSALQHTNGLATWNGQFFFTKTISKQKKSWNWNWTWWWFCSSECHHRQLESIWLALWNGSFRTMTIKRNFGNKAQICASAKWDNEYAKVCCQRRRLRLSFCVLSSIVHWALSFIINFISLDDGRDKLKDYF